MRLAPVDDMGLGHATVDGPDTGLHLGSHTGFQVRQHIAQGFHTDPAKPGINFYMDTPLSQLLETISPAQSQPVAETYVQNSTEMVQAAVQRAAAETDAEGLAGSVLRNREIVSKLYASGIFNIKDAVIQVADSLNISKNTVYLHLRHCKGLE